MMRITNNNVEFGPKSPKSSYNGLTNRIPSPTAVTTDHQLVKKMADNQVDEPHHSHLDYQLKHSINSSITSNSVKNVKFSLAAIFVVYLILVYTVYVHFPKLSDDERAKVKLPKNEQEVRQLASALVKYRDNNYLVLFTAITLLYIFLQSFAIPGSIMLSVLSGCLFPIPVALFLICLCSATGASICYCISYCFGRELVLNYFPRRAAEYRAKVAKNRPYLLFYLLFLRITPIIPNWVINIVSPLIDVPLSTFFWATFLGVCPPSFLHIQTVKSLQKYVNSDSGHSSFTNLLVIMLCAFLALAPVFFKRVSSRS